MATLARSRANSLTLSDEDGLNCDYQSADETADAQTAPFDFHKFINTKITAARQLLTTGKSLNRENKNKIVDIFNEITNINNHTASTQSEPLRFDTQNTQNPQNTQNNLSELKKSIISDLTGIIKTEITSLKKSLNTSQPQSRVSYAAAAAATSTGRAFAPALPSAIPVSKPALILSPSNEESTAQDTLQIFRASVSFKDTKFSPADVRFVSNSKVRVEFDSEEHRDTTLDKVRQAKCGLTAEPCKKLKPMLILKGVSDSTPCDQLVEIITTQNTFNIPISPGDLTFRFKRANKNNQLYNAVFLVAPPLWRAILTTGKVNIDHQRVHVEEHVPLLQCYTCLQFGHTRKNCTSPNPVCSHCSSLTHLYKDCPVKKDTSAVDCFNCIQHNKQFKWELDTRHSATSNTCSRVIHMTKKLQNRIDYGPQTV